MALKSHGEDPYIRCGNMIQGIPFNPGRINSWMTHTLDKNGSLYDTAGTESWNMQIRYENNEINDASYE